jgi:hypothetical protein
MAKMKTLAICKALNISKAWVSRYRAVLRDLNIITLGEVEFSYDKVYSDYSYGYYNYNAQ